MSGLGVHFALKEAEAKKLISMNDEQDRLEFVTEEIEEQYLKDDKQFAAESDKSWDAMHRVLADGELTWEGGEYPLNHVVLAGDLLYTEDDYIMSLKTPAQVKDIDKALNAITENEFKQKYFSVDPESYGSELTDEDFDYTWSWFETVRLFYSRAAEDDRYVLFTADQ